MTNPTADLEARANRETQRLTRMIAELRAVAQQVRDTSLPHDVQRRLLHALDAERVPLCRAREALAQYRKQVRDTRGNNWFTGTDG